MRTIYVVLLSFKGSCNWSTNRAFTTEAEAEEFKRRVTAGYGLNCKIEPTTLFDQNDL